MGWGASLGPQLLPGTDSRCSELTQSFMKHPDGSWVPRQLRLHAQQGHDSRATRGRGNRIVYSARKKLGVLMEKALFEQEL